MKKQRIVECFNNYIKSINELITYERIFIENETIELESSLIKRKFTEDELISILGNKVYNYYFDEENESGSYSSDFGYNIIPVEVSGSIKTWYDPPSYWDPPDYGEELIDLEVELPEDLTNIKVPKNLLSLYNKFIYEIKDLAWDEVSQNLDKYIN